MGIQEQLDQDLKGAMRSHDEVTRDTIRLIRSALRNAEIEKGGALDEAAVIDVLSRMTRQYRESIEMYRDGGRPELAAKEERELEIVLRYLPRQLSAEELRELAHQTASEVDAAGPQDKGKVMGRLMPQVRGKADGSMVNQVVSELLESLASGRA